MGDRFANATSRTPVARAAAPGEAGRHETFRFAPGAPLRTIVADPNAISRQMLGGQLRDDPRFQFAGAAAHEAALLRLLFRAPHDLAVIDSSLPPSGVIATVRAVVALCPDVAVVVLADVDDDPAAPEAALSILRAGAKGYLDRRLRPAGVVATLAAVALGEPALSRKLTMQLLTRLIESSEDVSGLRPVTSPLSDREWEVLDLLEGGLSTAQIGQQLVVSIETVRSHVKRILRKLEVHTRADAIMVARRLRRLV